MIPWIPLSVLSDLTRPETSPLQDDAHSSRYPLGFSDVRAHAVPAIPEPPAEPRAPVGFASTASDAPEVGTSGERIVDPVFRTELSFRRAPRAVPSVHAEAAGEWSSPPVQPEVGHASVEPSHDVEPESVTEVEVTEVEVAAEATPEMEQVDEITDEPVAQHEEETPQVVDL